ncbi:MAG: hypothetical protein ACFFC7_33375, partial [Candidatus Hermodarchaeota archaeon]
VIMPIIPPFLAKLKDFSFMTIIFPNPFSIYFMTDQNLSHTFFAILIFPGPFLHILSFLIYFWKPLRIKTDLYLLSIRNPEIIQKLSKEHQKYFYGEKQEETSNKRTVVTQQTRNNWKDLYSKLIARSISLSILITIDSIVIWKEDELLLLLIPILWIWIFMSINLLIPKLVGDNTYKISHYLTVQNNLIE